MYLCTRHHDISTGHRVCNHESKCAHLHGHNYRIHFHCQGRELDSLGRVIDFGVIKERLCMWVEREWDHRFLIWENDPLASYLVDIDKAGVVRVPFNPTAENMAQYLCEVIGPRQLVGTGVWLSGVSIEETRKCNVVYQSSQVKK